MGDEWGRPLRFDAGMVEDEWGNVVKFERRTIQKKTLFGAFLPAASKRMAVHLIVIRAQNSPRNATAGFPVLEGVVSADGLGVEFNPLPDAAQFGIREMPTGRIKRVGPAWDDSVQKDWRELSFDVIGEVRSKEFKSLESRIGEVGQWQILIFPEGSSESGGILTNSGNGVDWRVGGGTYFIGKVSWRSPSTMLIPGAKIRVGIHESLKNDDARFDLELPTLVQPR